MRYAPKHLQKTKKRLFLPRFLLAMALLGLTVSTCLLLQPFRQAQAAPAQDPEPPAYGERLSTLIPLPETGSPKGTIAPDEAAAADADEAPANSEAIVPEKEKPAGELSATEILANSRLVAHGMGSIGGLTTPNCVESFLAQYEAGVRVFEVDLRLTRDAQVVLRHDWWVTWQDGIDWVHIPTLEKFLSEKILDTYTPLSFRDLLLLMEAYPDICVITDTKFTESDIFSIQFDAMLADAHELGLTYLFDRIAIQVYDGNMRTGLNNIYPFPHYIYTLYQDSSFKGTTASFREKAAYCAERGIKGITMDQYWWKPAFAAIAEEYGIKVYVHTVNDIDKAKKLLAEGVSGVYTDSIKPEDIA